MSGKITRFDHVLKRMLDAHNKCLWHISLAIEHNVGVRRNAYRFAKHLIDIRTNHHNAFVGWIHSQKAKLDDWLDEHFTPIESEGQLESRKALFEAIEQGMTEKDFARMPSTVWKRQQREKREKTTKGARASRAVDTPPDTLSDKDRANYWEGVARSFQAELKQAKGEVRELRADLARVTRRLNNLLNTLDKGKRRTKTA